MKKVLLLGALLSTMAFGVTGTGKSDDVIIKLTGVALQKLEVQSNAGSLNFGNVVAGSDLTIDSTTITVKGTEGGKAKLTATLSGTNSDTLTVGFDNDVPLAATSAAKENLAVTPTGVTTTLKVNYAPVDAEDSLGEDTKITLTAIYTE